MLCCSWETPTRAHGCSEEGVALLVQYVRLGLVLGGRHPVVLTGHADASWADDQAMQQSSQGYTFSLGSGSVSWRSTRSSSVLGSSCKAEIYAGAMAAQELRWLTYLLTDLGEPPHSPPFMYVDNKAMLALCREHRLEHRMKHIALRYFLARELQQRGQLRLAYVASEANTADIFTKALAPGEHQRFCTMLDCVVFLLCMNKEGGDSMIPTQQRGGKLAPKARWGIHLSVSPESRGWEVLDLTANRIVTTVEAIFYEAMSLEEWKVEHGPASERTKISLPTGPSPAAISLLESEDDGPSNDPSPSVPPSFTPPPPLPTSLPSLPLGLPKSASTSAASDEGSIGASPSAPAIGIAGGRRDLASEQVGVGVKSPPTGEPSNKERVSEDRTTGEQFEDGTSSDVVEVTGGTDGELSIGEQSSDSDVVDISADKPAVRCSTRSNFGKPPERLSYHACLSPISYSTLLDDALSDVDLPELDPDMHADPEHRWDIANTTVKEALASWKGKAVKAAMDEEIRSLITNGT
ncbi:unnamed protein product [Closterium sp. NIES-54]